MSKKEDVDMNKNFHNIYHLEEGVDLERQVFYQYLNMTEIMLFAADVYGVINYVSDQVCQFLNMNRSDILGRNMSEFVSRQDGEKLHKLLKRLVETDYKQNQDFHLDTEVELPRSQGSNKIISLRMGPLWDSEGTLSGVVCACEDITTRKQLESAYQESETKFRNMAENIPGIIYLCHNDEDFTIIYLNDNVEDVTGYAKERFLNRDISLVEIIHEEDLPQVNALIDSALEENRPFHLVYRILNARGEIRWLEERGVGVYEERELNYLEGFVHDITARKEAEDHIRYLSFYDDLTGLYNRRFFREELHRLGTDRQLPMSVILGDVNGLKLVNDAFGHIEGDMLLIKTAEIVKNSCREEDIVARYGGDEFIVLLPQTGEEQAELIANRLRANIQREEFNMFNMSMSLGVATKNSNEDKTGETLISEAEERMYQKKISESKKVRNEIIDSLMKFLRKKSYETEIHCQRLKQLSRKLGAAINLPESELDKLTNLAVLHDVGKVTIEEEILKKQTALTDEEWQIIKKHPEDGYKIAMSAPELAPIAEATLHHHERWDGQGYPQGLDDGDIPLLSRIIAIADAYDVMTRGRSYKAPISKEKALLEILRCSGSQFDPNLAQVFVDLMRDIKKFSDDRQGK